MLLLGIDIGTSACKTAVFEKSGAIVCSATAKYPVYYPKAGYAEQDPNEWYDAICRCLKELCQKVDPADIRAVGLDGQSWSCIPVDQNGKVLHNTPIWFDTRSMQECKQLAQKIGSEEIFAVSKNPLQPAYTTPKVLWFQNNLPEVYEKTHQFLQSNSYIAYRLTGAFAQDRSMAYAHFFYDPATGQYDEQMAEKMGMDLKLFPENTDCHTVIGEVTQEAAAKTGLNAGTPVVIGGLDAACGTLGAGVYLPGQTQEQGGQAGGMSICMDVPKTDPRLILGNHVVPGVWLLQGGTVGGGSAIQWFSEQFGKSFLGEYQNVFQGIDAQAKNVPPGSEGVVFLPYMNGERSPIWDASAKGVYYGLSFSKTRAHMARATMEGVAYALRHNLEVASAAGAKINRLHTMGGSANSALWTQMKADVTGYPVDVMEADHASTLGAVILAGIGTGIYQSFEEAVKLTVSTRRSYEPRYFSEYDAGYEKYREIYECLKGAMQS